jgi:hypothetical protein
MRYPMRSNRDLIIILNFWAIGTLMKYCLLHSVSFVPLAQAGSSNQARNWQTIGSE